MLAIKENRQGLMSSGFDNLKTIVSDRDYYIAHGVLDDRVEYLLRRRLYQTPRQHTQSLANFWFFIRWTGLQHGDLYLQYAQKRHSICGDVYIYIPRYCCVEWVVKAGLHEYITYQSSSEPEPFFPDHPVVFSSDYPMNIQGYDDIAQLLMMNKDRELSGARTASYVAGKTKGFLDDYFAESLSFDTISQELNIPYSTMAAAFKSYYGVPANKYRNILRTFDAYNRIMKGESVTQAAYAAGFSGLTQYNQNFHEHLKLPPSAFAKTRGELGRVLR